MEMTKTLHNGEIIIKTDEGVYFHALNSETTPILIDKEEGEHLMSIADMNLKANNYKSMLDEFTSLVYEHLNEDHALYEYAEKVDGALNKENTDNFNNPNDCNHEDSVSGDDGFMYCLDCNNTFKECD